MKTKRDIMESGMMGIGMGMSTSTLGWFMS